MKDIKPFGNNPTFSLCSACKSKVACSKAGKCLLKKEMKEFAERNEKLLILFALKDEERSRFDRRRRAKTLPSNLGKGNNTPKSPAGKKIGVIKDGIYRKTKGGTLEKRNVLPDKLTKKKSAFRKSIDKENAKIAMLTQQEAESAKVRSKNLRNNAKMSIKPSKKFAKNQGVVTAQVDDPKKYQKPAKGKHQRGDFTQKQRQNAKAKEAKAISSNQKTRARKAKYDDLDVNQKEKAIKTAMKNHSVNRRGAKSLLRKSLLAAFTRRRFS